MAPILVIAILLIGLFLIATENINRMNKAAVAIFTGTACWMVCLLWGTDDIARLNAHELSVINSGLSDSGFRIQEFISYTLFGSYIKSACEIVFFMLAIMTIVEVLNNNGCFDFVNDILKRLTPVQFMWFLAIFTFLVSANLDNLTTACLMLAIVHSLIPTERLRRLYGFVVLISANLGGTFTVIGDTTSLTLWANGLVTATHYSAMLVLPCLAALITILLLLSNKLPHHIRYSGHIAPYRGDDTILNGWQRILMLIVGIGGLWFIPTFHRLTEFPPFLGALCVLSLLWIVNELCNRTLMYSDQMVNKKLPMAMQYANVQNLLFYLGIVLAFGAVNEIGVLQKAADFLIQNLNNEYILACIAGIESVFINSITSIVGNSIMFSHVTDNATFATDAMFWPLMSFCTSLGGMVLGTGTLAGLYYIRMEEVSIGTYLKHYTWKIMLGWVVGIIVFLLVGLM